MLKHYKKILLLLFTIFCFFGMNYNAIMSRSITLGGDTVYAEDDDEDDDFDDIDSDDYTYDDEDNAEEDYDDDEDLPDDEDADFIGKFVNNDDDEETEPGDGEEEDDDGVNETEPDPDPDSSNGGIVSNGGTTVKSTTKTISCTVTKVTYYTITVTCTSTADSTKKQTIKITPLAKRVKNGQNYYISIKQSGNLGITIGGFSASVPKAYKDIVSVGSTKSFTDSNGKKYKRIKVTTKKAGYAAINIRIKADQGTKNNVKWKIKTSKSTSKYRVVAQRNLALVWDKSNPLSYSYRVTYTNSNNKTKTKAISTYSKSGDKLSGLKLNVSKTLTLSYIPKSSNAIVFDTKLHTNGTYALRESYNSVIPHYKVVDCPKGKKGDSSIIKIEANGKVTTLKEGVVCIAGYYGNHKKGPIKLKITNSTTPTPTTKTTSKTTSKTTGGGGGNTPSNPQTGTIGIAIAWFVGIFALTYSILYFKKSFL